MGGGGGGSGRAGTPGLLAMKWDDPAAGSLAAKTLRVYPNGRSVKNIRCSEPDQTNCLVYGIYRILSVLLVNQIRILKSPCSHSTEHRND